ncbi:MAG: amidohydrolase [Burkholderiaceae bacterium]|nr:MAG: amidohydrolase [Burkholderiaceae bacterium]
MEARIDVDSVRKLRERADALLPKMVAWRRDIHRNPELSEQEERTAGLVAAHLRTLGLEVRTGVGGHGVVGLLEGGKSGGVVGLRADMDALPVKETTGLPFASGVLARNFGKMTPVAHACGHDGHTAILMGVAEMLSGMRDQIAGSVKFIFQPAEEGRSSEPADPKTPYGAKAMVAQGALDNPKVDAIFGLHITSAGPTGTIGYRSGPTMAGADGFRIRVTGRQTHGAQPWSGVDPIFAAAQIVMGLQAIVSRQIDISKAPAVLSIGAIHGGNRENIIPDEVEMLGTLRTFDHDVRADAKRRLVATVETIAAASGAKAEVSFTSVAYAPTINPEGLTAQAAPVLRAVAGEKAIVIHHVSGSEDFSDFQAVVPGFFFFLGATPKGKSPQEAAPNHSPLFDFDEDAMAVGAQALAALALDQLARTA